MLGRGSRASFRGQNAAQVGRRRRRVRADARPAIPEDERHRLPPHDDLKARRGRARRRCDADLSNGGSPSGETEGRSRVPTVTHRVKGPSVTAANYIADTESGQNGSAFRSSYSWGRIP